MLFYQEELVYFKNRLAEILSSDTGLDELQVAEQFQEEFLAQDKVVGYLLAEIKGQSKLLEKDLYVDGDIFDEVVTSQKKIRREIQKEEELFKRLKKRFVQYLSEQY